MSNRKSQQMREYWKQQLAEWSQSGLSGIRYCKTHNLSYHRFSYWRSQLLKTENKAAVGR